MVYKILFVDDEKDILSSLRRLFMEDWCEIFTASSGQEALELIKKEPVDLIVSDQRMPAMEGVEFLKQSKKYLPDSIRILLTGYADVNAAIDSINEGGVSRYFTKPWNNDELKEAIHDALELRKLRNENERLLELTEKQNLELKDLNANLEKKVKEQTKDLRKMLFEVKKLNGELDESLMNTVKVLSNVTCMKTRSDSASFKNVSKLSKAIAQERKLARNEIRDIEVAALVYDIGI
ncbi:MAG: response regulator, partial [Candidatus Anammoxibacter sp.]